MSGKTAGRRAYDAWWATAEGVPRHPDVTYDQDGAAWEAAAAAGAAAAQERVAGLVTEVNDLRKLLGEIKAVVLWDGTHQTKLRRVLELLGVFGPQPEAVVTAGTEHLAEKIRGLAIPDEES